ncbi:6223_t:CDS:1, partial [Cetraspora pellucida]
MPQRGASKRPDKGNKFGNLPSNRYLPSQTELEKLLNQANND